MGLLWQPLDSLLQHSGSSGCHLVVIACEPVIGGAGSREDMSPAVENLRRWKAPAVWADLRKESLISFRGYYHGRLANSSL